MKNSNPTGRPAKGELKLTKEQVLRTALKRISSHGVEAISFRALADELGVTAMAVSYHVGSKAKMLKNLVELAFSDLAQPLPNSSPEDQLESIMTSYCKRALKHVNLLRCILAETSLMSNELVLLTEQIRKNTQALNYGDPGDVLLNLLVDYTHGHVLSHAHGVQAATEHNGSMASDTYEIGIRLLLNLLKTQIESEA